MRTPVMISVFIMVAVSMASLHAAIPPKPAPLKVYGANKIGCFKDTFGNRAFPELVALDRKTVDFYDDIKAAKRCRDIVLAKGPEYSDTYGVQFWSECWVGKKSDKSMDYDKHGPATDCLGQHAGGGLQNMVYTLNRNEM